MIQPGLLRSDQCRDQITKSSEKVNQVLTRANFYAHLCCISLINKLLPEPDKIEPCPDKTIQKPLPCKKPFPCKCHEESLISNACHGDLYSLGLLWISAMKTALLGFDVFPAIGAAPPALPEKPPKMPFKELPLYDSPHKDYKEAKEASIPVCPEAKEKLLQNYLLPTVSTYRQMASDVYYQKKCEARNLIIDNGKFVEKKYNDFVTYMRDPENLPYRIGAVALSSLIGLRLGWRGGIPRKAFFTGLGALAGGALAFPTETDIAFRNLAFQTGNAFFVLYNFFYGTCAGMPESKPCPEPVKERLSCPSTESYLPSKQVPCPLDPPPK